MHCFHAPVFLLYLKCVAFPIKQKALRVDRTAAEQNLSLREPPQAENPASQESIFTVRKIAKQDPILLYRKRGFPQAFDLLWNPLFGVNRDLREERS